MTLKGTTTVTTFNLDLLKRGTGIWIKVFKEVRWEQIDIYNPPVLATVTDIRPHTIHLHYWIEGKGSINTSYTIEEYIRGGFVILEIISKYEGDGINE